jgi:hypothetical protein
MGPRVDANHIYNLLKLPHKFSKLRKGDIVVSNQDIHCLDIGAGVFPSNSEFLIAGTKQTSQGTCYLLVKLSEKNPKVILPISYFNVSKD